MLQLLCKIYHICHAGPEDWPIGGIKITCIGHVRNPNQSDDSRIIIVRFEDIVQVLTSQKIFKYWAASTERSGLPNNLDSITLRVSQSSRPKIKEITGSTAIFETKN